MAAPAESREREFAAPTRAAETSLEGLPSHQGDGDSAAPRLALQGRGEIIRETDRCAPHTCIIASPTGSFILGLGGSPAIGHRLHR